MSVAAMTMDDQRLQNYNSSNAKQQQREYLKQNSGVGGFVMSGPASPTPSDPPPHQHDHVQHMEQTEQEHESVEQRMLEGEIENLKAERAQLLQQYADSQRREKILTRRLANKEQEFQDYVSQIAEYKAARAPSAIELRNALLDPAVNLIFEKLKKELKATKAKLEETQNELAAWKFTPDSNTGKRLMAKCRLLYQENEELGKMTSSGRLAKLETELAMQKKFSEEVKKSQLEFDDFLQELDEDVEGMQSTILFLQQELKMTRERIQVLEKENFQMRNGNGIVDGDGDIVSSENIPDKDIDRVESNNMINKQFYHTGINGNTKTSLETEHVEINQNESKFQTTSSLKLTPIQEEPCVRVSAYTCGNVGVGGGVVGAGADATEYFNGSTVETHKNNSSVAIDDSATVINNKPRIGIRKRAYDSSEFIETNIETTIPTNTTTTTAKIQIPTPVPVTQTVIAPRTLPPKKSKLRMTPPSLLQQQDLYELNESDVTCPVTNLGANIPAPTLNTHESPLIVDTTAMTTTATVTGTATATTTDNIVACEETPISTTITTTPIPLTIPTPLPITTTTPIAIAASIDDNSSSAPQRIMTRRRSMRMQQNGA